MVWNSTVSRRRTAAVSFPCYTLVNSSLRWTERGQSMSNREVQILLVDDDDVDSEAIQRSFQCHKIANPIYRVSDGQEALAALRGEQGYALLPRPYMILL